MISIDDFSKLDLRAAKVLEAARVDGSDKLLQLKLDLAANSATCSPASPSNYKPEDLVGRYVVMIANLAPRKMRFGVLRGHGALCQRQGWRWQGRVRPQCRHRRAAGHESHLKPERVVALYSALRAVNPEPRSELEFRSPF